ncbi:MAG TPA: DUF4476 domain-containing protein [Ferruginibacter sp.]|nr:DUF4476 domain-containing protein [Ferruginibacter sp.]
MRKLFYCLLFIVCCKSSIAQQNHYIYIQTESNQPFYVKLNNQVYSSTGSGYVILSKLHEGSYIIKIGFIKSGGGEQNFVCTIDKNDIGYLLKNFQDKGWGLFNLQTMGITMASSRDTVLVAPKPKTDAFSTMLSTAVNDPTIQQQENQKKADAAPVAQPVDSPKEAAPLVENAAAPIAKLKPIIQEDSAKTVAKPAATASKADTVRSAKTITISNANCKGEASNDDFLKLRKKMASYQSDADMITAAKKVFKQKCFTTADIKNLSVLFLKDEGKYNFFDAAYPYVSDGNFSSLEDQLTDNYYISRFRIMVRH